MPSRGARDAVRARLPERLPAMSDDSTTVAVLRQAMRSFVAERNWEPFHTPKNLSMGAAVEAAELMEHFLWVDNEESRHLVQDTKRREQIADEMADVLCYLLALSNSLGIDLSEAVLAKLAKNAIKYPAEQYRGRYRLEE
jgi:dCTP diphosphatase